MMRDRSQTSPCAARRRPRSTASSIVRPAAPPQVPDAVAAYVLAHRNTTVMEDLMTKLTAPALGAALGVTGSAGCGADPEEERVRETFRASYPAVAAADGTKACALLTDRARRSAEAARASER